MNNCAAATSYGMNKDKIVFFGTSEFAVPSLEALIKEGYEIMAVITTPDEPTGRKQILTPPSVKIVAQKLGLKILQPKSLKIENLKFKIPDADVGVIASYGKIIPLEILNQPKYGFINIHPSLLPKYRGPSPIQYTLLNGDEETGVTIMKVDAQVDHGLILAKSQKLNIQNEKFQELHNELAKIGAELLIKTLPDYLAGKIEPMEQDHNQATFTKIIKKEDGKIDWHKSAQEIYNQFRAFDVWPGIWTMWNDKILKITDCKISAEQSYHNHDREYIAQVYNEDGIIFVPCSNGHIQILRLQLEGGKEMPITDFLSGHKDFVGSKLML